MLWWHRSFVSHVCKESTLGVFHENSFAHGCMLNKLACHSRVFWGTVFLERLFVNPPPRQRWLTSVLPLGYFYLLGRSFALQRWWNLVEVGRERQRKVCVNKHQRCAIDFVSGGVFFFFSFFFLPFLFQEVCYLSPPCVCVGMPGFGVHHDRRGGSAHLDGEALHRTSAVHTRPGRRAGTLLLQLLLHLLLRRK